MKELIMLIFLTLLLFLQGCNNSVTPSSYKTFLNQLSNVTIIKKENLETWYRLKIANVDGYKKIASKNGSFIALANPVSHGKVISKTGDKIVSSSDGLNWIDTNKTLDIVNATIISTPDYFYAVGASLENRQKGAIVRSSDGLTWEKVYDSANPLKDIVYANNTFIAVGLNGNIVNSADGKNWQTNHIGDNISLYCAIAGNKEFLAIGDPNAIYSSKDAKNWKKISTELPTVGIRNGIYKNGMYLLFSNDYMLIYKNNKFTPLKKKSNLMETIYNDEFIDLNNTMVISSNDGERWIEKAKITDIDSTFTSDDFKDYFILNNTLIFVK